MMLTTSQLRNVWGPPCDGFRKAKVVLYGGAPVTVDQRTVDAWHALSTIMARHGYPADPATTGGYNCRKITGGTGYSLHAYGIAVDINWNRNAYGTTLVTDMPTEMVHDILNIRTVSGHQIFGWGGNYQGHKDAMHYEIVVTPGDLQSGVSGIPLDQHPIKPPNPTPDPTRPPEAIDMAQTNIIATNADGRLEEFGIYPGDHDTGTVIHRWEASPGGTWSGWVPIDGGAVVTLSKGLSSTLANGRLVLMAAAAPVYGSVPVKISQTAPNGGWTHFQTF